MNTFDKMSFSNALLLSRLAGFEFGGPAKLLKHRSMGIPISSDEIAYNGDQVTELEVAYPIFNSGKNPDPSHWPSDALKFTYKIAGEAKQRSVAFNLEVNTSTGEMRLLEIEQKRDGWL